MTAYASHVLLGVGRLVLAFALGFVLYPRVAFAWVEGGRVRRPAPWEGVLLMSGATVAALHALVLLGLYDPVVLLVLALALGAATAVRRSRGRGDLAERALHAYARGLGRLDGAHGADPAAWGRTAARAARRWLRGPAPAVAALLLYVAATRLAPAVGGEAPFSTHAYGVLESVKHLEAGTLAPGGTWSSRGVHSLMLAVSALSRVDLGLVVHVFGAAAAVLVTYGLYRSVRDLTGGAAAGWAAAALFALGGPLLPSSLAHQVEASAATLAAAFALPAVAFLGRYLSGGARRHRRAGAGALLAAVLTHGTVGVLTAGSLAVLAAAGAMRGAGARAGHVAGFALTGALALAGALALPAALAPGGRPSVLRLAESLATSAPLGHLQPLPWLGAAVPIVAAGLALAALRRPLAASAGGSALLLVGLYAAYRAAWSGSLPLLDREATGLALGLALCAGAGVLLHAVLVAAEARLALARPARLRLRGAAGVVLAAGLLSAAGVAVPALPPPVEPDGFVRALRAVEAASPPRTWTVVSHAGTGIRAMNGGWFMDYAYFLNRYDPLRYEPGDSAAVATESLYLFVGKDPLAAEVVGELMPGDDRLMLHAAEWARAYGRRHPLPAFYEDDDVVVYRIVNPPPPRPMRGPRAEPPWPRPMRIVGP